MKISRNQPCPCGSGKKYKMCCGGKPHLHPQISKDYFHLKGRKAEQFVQDLALKTFLIDWCYLNPRLPDGKELCDLLVVFDNIAIIWQVKDLKLNEQHKYKGSEIEKNLRQISGARRQLFELKTKIELENPRRGKELFDPTTISKIYLISVHMGEEQEFSSPIEDVKNYHIHAFTKRFTEIILNELDTVGDFCDYLRRKEDFLNNIELNFILIQGGEEELLAFYLISEKSFKRVEKARGIVLNEGHWEYLQKKPEYKAKKQHDKISYLWDSIINRNHEGGSEYEKVAREFAQPNRFERRVLSRFFLDVYKRAHMHNSNGYSYYLSINGITYCFVFQDDPEPRNNRKKMLEVLCRIARGKFQNNRKVIGIATEKTIMPKCSYDFCVIYKPHWTEKDQKYAEELQKMTKPFNVRTFELTEDEYPKPT